MSTVSPQITICVPVYRRGYQIQRTLNSIRNQTFRDFVVDVAIEPAEDDAETHHWCEEFARADDRFKITLNGELHGWGGNINSQIKRVKTPFFMVLPHDDALHVQCVEHLFQRIQAHPTAAIVFPDIYFFGGVTGLQACEEVLNETANERLWSYLINGGAPEFWKGLTRTEMLESSDFPNGIDDDFSAEYEWALRLVSAGKVIRESQAVYYKRTHAKDSESVSAGWVYRMAVEERYQMLRRHLGRCRDYLEKLGQGFEVKLAMEMAWINLVFELGLDQHELNQDAAKVLKSCEAAFTKLPASLHQEALALLNFIKGRDCLIRESFEDAEVFFRKSLALKPGAGRYSVFLVKALLRLEQHDEALSVFLQHSRDIEGPDWRSQELIGWFQNVLTNKMN